ncbi:MAG: glutamate racemase [Anaerolineae bacterium]|nr:glutamate racemase [Anaerolineae bacterium]
MDRPANGPIAIFDSGVGGLSVLCHIAMRLPRENLLYLADQAHVPYGPRPAREVRAFAEGITRFFLAQGARLIVVACNTATAAALTTLRETFPQVPFVGMEPAVKPGARETRTGRVGVLATAGTFESQRYADLMARYTSDVHLYEDPCRGLVPLVEAGRLDDDETETLVRSCLAPMLAAGVDTIVLGCTHYPFILPLIARLAGPDVTLIDPAPAVARQAQWLLLHHRLATARAGRGRLMMLTSGDPVRFARLAARLLDQPVAVRGVHWHGGALSAAPAATIASPDTV